MNIYPDGGREYQAKFSPLHYKVCKYINGLSSRISRDAELVLRITKILFAKQINA